MPRLLQFCFRLAMAHPTVWFSNLLESHDFLVEPRFFPFLKEKLAYFDHKNIEH